MRQQLQEILRMFSIAGKPDATVEELSVATGSQAEIIEAMLEPLILLGVFVRSGQSVQLAREPANSRAMVASLLRALESGEPAIRDFRISDGSARWVDIVRAIDDRETVPASRHGALAAVLVVGKDEKDRRWLLCRIDRKNWHELKLPIGKVFFEPTDRRFVMSVEQADAERRALEALVRRFSEEFFQTPSNLYLQPHEENAFAFVRREQSGSMGQLTWYYSSVRRIKSYGVERFPYPAGSTLAWLSQDKFEYILETHPELFFPDQEAGAFCLSQMTLETNLYFLSAADTEHIVTDDVLTELLQANKKRGRNRLRPS